MKRSCQPKPVAAVAIAFVVSAAAAFGQTSRWEDLAMSFEIGSAELTLEKRIFEPGPHEPICKRCKHYVNLRFGLDEQNRNGVDLDITHLIAAYRYYAYVQLKEAPDGLKHDGGWAAYLDLGLGRYDLDRLGPRSGYSLRAGVDRKVTEACTRDGKLKKWFVDWEVSSTYHRVELPGKDLDYWSVQTGPRILFSSKRSRERAKNVGCPRGDTDPGPREAG